jgi:hypothetical protein
VAGQDGAGTWLEKPGRHVALLAPPPPPPRPTTTIAPVVTNDHPKISLSPLPPLGPAEGDFWWDTTRGFLFTWYNDGNTIQWVVANPGMGKEEGPPGLTGDTGPQGIQGETGDTGPQGIPGPVGPQGADSTVPGPAGPIGPQGPVGAQGPQGTPGADSTFPGPVGPAGPTGATGAQGPQGVKGDTGATGATGAQGPQGIQGVPGPTGPVPEAPLDGQQYARQSAGWSVVTGGGGASTAVGLTPPASPTVGQLWFNSDGSAGGGQTYLWYDDGTSAQWVPVTPMGSGGGGVSGDYLPLAGGTLTGDLTVGVADVNGVFLDDLGWLGVTASTPGVWAGINISVMSNAANQKHWQITEPAASGGNLRIQANADDWALQKEWIFDRTGITSFPGLLSIQFGSRKYAIDTDGYIAASDFYVTSIDPYLGFYVQGAASTTDARRSYFGASGADFAFTFRSDAYVDQKKWTFQRSDGSTTFPGALTGTTATFVTTETGAASNPLLNLQQTWNNATTLFTGITYNVTDTASNINSLLLNFQVNGAYRFYINKSGTGVLAGSLVLGATNQLSFTTRSNLYSPADGQIALRDTAGTSFNRLQFGGITNAFPSIKRNATALNFRLADDTADAPITAGAATFSGNVTHNSTLAVGAGAATQAFVKASSTADLGIYYGTGVPSFTAAKGSLYSNTTATTTTTRLYVNTNGSTTWANLTTST